MRWVVRLARVRSRGLPRGALRGRGNQVGCIAAAGRLQRRQLCGGGCWFVRALYINSAPSSSSGGGAGVEGRDGHAWLVEVEGVYTHLLSFSPLPWSFRSQSLFSVFLCHLREAAREAQQNRSNRDHNCSCSVQRQRAHRPSTSCSIIIMWHATHMRVASWRWTGVAERTPALPQRSSVEAMVGSCPFTVVTSIKIATIAYDQRVVYILDLAPKFGAHPTGIIDLAMQHVNRHQCHHLPEAILTPGNQPSCSISLQKRRG